MYIFVYGTLKEGYRNHYLLEDSEFVCEATTKDRYPMINMEIDFPYLIDKVGTGHHIKGEVYKIDTKTLIMLDVLEGYPEHYNRENITVVNSGIELKTMVYFLNEEVDYSSFELIDNF